MAVLLVVIGGYGIVRAVVDTSSTTSSSGPAAGNPQDSPKSPESHRPSRSPATAGPSHPSRSPDNGGEGGGYGRSGTIRIPGPTLNNVYPQDKDNEGRFSATGGCLVMVNANADIPIQIRSIRMQGGTQAKIPDEPCDTPAEGSSWNDETLGVTDPVNPCSPGITLEPASVSPRHACNIHIVRAPGLGAETALVDIEVVARCTSKAPRPCSLLGEKHLPSAEHPVTAIVHMTYPALFQADTENTTPGSETPEESPDTEETQDPPTETAPTETDAPDDTLSKESSDTGEPQDSPAEAVPTEETPAESGT
ncbi:hypothetical protein [Streptosporangium vulgare]|uniref:hypothetical protein n=1 Tax=Streptosporangium vulgare TaxID=46190 RepID=UPI0036DAA059